jgi:DNA invertase Pin-like site-specific DNA recombinase
MRDRLAALGWSEIEVIDDDLGRSAAGSVQRAGFERMLAEVCLGKVGAVCAREVSRFARNSRDWQQLIEMCRVVDTVLIDQETVYAPRNGNDRLLLGLKGSLNEYELDLLRQRSLSGTARFAKRSTDERSRGGENADHREINLFRDRAAFRCRHGHWAILSPEPPGELRRHVSVSLSRRLRIFLVRLIASVTTASDRVVTGTERRG